MNAFSIATLFMALGPGALFRLGESEGAFRNGDIVALIVELDRRALVLGVDRRPAL
jgi:hypothetical protein